MVTIPGPLIVDINEVDVEADEGRPVQQELFLNDIVEKHLQNAHEVLDGEWGQDWALGSAITVHSSQGLTIADPQKVWIIDDRTITVPRAILSLTANGHEVVQR